MVHILLRLNKMLKTNVHFNELNNSGMLLIYTRLVLNRQSEAFYNFDLISDRGVFLINLQKVEIPTDLHLHLVIIKMSFAIMIY